MLSAGFDNHAVTLNDLNESVIGALTFLGSASGPGKLHAPNGILLRAEKTLFGHGSVSSEFENQGDVISDGPLPDDGVLFTGAVVGLGDFDGNITFADRYAPGDGADFIAFGGNVAWEPGARLEIRISGLQAGVGYSRLDIGGTASLAGTFQVVLGIAPAVGDNFTIMTFGSSGGDFAGLIGLDVGNGLRLVPYLIEHSFSLHTESFIKGDVNRDGNVSGLDVEPFVAAVIWNSYSHNADVNSDGLVNGLDVAPFVEAVIAGGASAGVAQFSTAQHVAPVATVDPDSALAAALMPPLVEQPLRMRHAHNSHDDNHATRLAHGSAVDRAFTRRPHIRTRVGCDERRLRRDEMFRPVQDDGLDDWHVAVDDALGGAADWGVDLKKRSFFRIKRTKAEPSSAKARSRHFWGYCWARSEGRRSARSPTMWKAGPVTEMLLDRRNDGAAPKKSCVCVSTQLH